MMLAGASWAIFAARPLATMRSVSLLFLGATLVVAFGLSLTAGRMGYVTWAVVGLLLCLIRWRKYLLLAPVAATAIVFLVPGVSERLLQGFSEDTVDSNTAIAEARRREVITLDGGGTSIADANGPDLYTVISGRTFAWPFVIEKIGESPLYGSGRQAMKRTGLSRRLLRDYGEGFPHPHNAYLELLLDTGWIGFALVIPFYLLVIKRSVSLFRDPRSPVFLAVGGMTLVLVSAFLVAGAGSQTFYPREGALGMWCAIGLMLRVYVERSKTAAVATRNQGGVLRPSTPSIPRRQSPQRRPVVAARTAGRWETRARPDETPDTNIDELLWQRSTRAKPIHHPIPGAGLYSRLAS